MTFNVLSLFDGMSCGQIALNRAGIKYDNYFASEIENTCIEITQKYFSATIQLGNVCDVTGTKLPKIDLLLGGTPCQGFSFSGKGLNFKDSKSKLFFEFVRLLKETNPKYFLLENVKMKKEYENIISGYLKVDPIEINSLLVSAQNRRRLYWTNISDIRQPKNKNILLKDIIHKDSEVSWEYRKVNSGIENRLKQYENHKRILLNINKSNTGMSGMILRRNAPKSHCLTASGSNWIKYGYLIDSNKTLKYRRMSPVEWERLQTIDDNYTEGFTVGQRCQMLGNGWTVDVIVHILKNIKGNPEPKKQRQLGFLSQEELKEHFNIG